MYIGHHTVHLAHVSNAKGCQQTEAGEECRKYNADGLTAFFAAETVPQIIHGASAPLTLGIFTAVENAENVFRVICHHAKKGDQPHPEYGARSANSDGAGYTYNITCAYGSGKGGTKGLKLGDRFILRMFCNMFVPKDSADGVFYPVAEMGNLKKLCEASHQHAHKSQKDQSGPAPDKTINIVIYFGDCFNH